MNTAADDATMADQTPLQKAIAQMGGVAAAAKAMGITYEAVRKWLASGKLPVERVLQVEELTGIQRSKLRPDIYPPRSRS